MMNKATRAQVYIALDSERAYQAERWNRDTTSTAGEHESLADWIMFMENYLHEAKNIMSRQPEPDATKKALHTLRKVTALGVAAMESLGAPVRPKEEFPSYKKTV
jgi:hypothetical protein